MSSHAPPGSPAEDVAPLIIRANKLDLLERLADDLAHEIKNPLHSMVINLEVLKRRLGQPEGGADLSRYVGVLSAEMERVNRRIELLLRMTRPDRPSESVSLNDVLEESLELLHLEARRADLQLRFEPAAQAIRVAASRELVRQAILNLALEAVDVTEAGGELLLRTGRDDAYGHVVVQGAGSVDSDGSRAAATRLLAESVGGRFALGPPLQLSLPLRA